MLLLLKNKKFTQPVWIPSWCSFASLKFLSPCYWNFQRKLLPVMVLMQGGLCWTQMFQSCSSGWVGCCPYSGVCPFFQQSPDSQDVDCERNCRDHNSFVLIPRVFWFYFSYCGIQPYLVLYLCLSKMNLPQNRVLAYVPPALFECFGMYFLWKEWFVAWHFTDALADSTSLMH